MKSIKYRNRHFEICNTAEAHSTTCIDLHHRSNLKFMTSCNDDSARADSKIEEAIDFIHSYAPNIVEWKVLKRELLNSISPEYRKLFSKKDVAINEISLNDLEKTIIEYWQKLTGIKIYLNES